MKGLTLFIVIALLPSATFAETAGQAEVRQELERMFAPTPGPRPHPSQVITPLIRKYGRENVADMALQPLTAALKGTNNYFMQEQIAWALFELKDPRSVGALIEFLRIEKFGDWGAEKTLIAIGEPAVAPLVEAFRSGNTNQQFLQKAAKVLGELKDVRAVAGLIEGLRSNDRSLPRVCAEALASIGGTDAVDGLIAALKAGNPVAKLSATKALGPMKNPRTVPALIELLKDKDRNLRGEAARALGEIGDPVAIDALVSALTDSKVGVEGEVSKALSQMRNSGAAPILLERFRDAKNPAERNSLLRALTYMGDRGLDVMIATLEDADAETRHTALKSLHAMSTGTVAAEAVNESNQQRARQAILAYFEAGNADDLSYPERVSIIASIHEPRAVELALRTLKKKEEGYEDCPWYVPQDIYIAFEKARPSVIDPLIEAIADPDPSVRAGAAAVLGHLPLRMYGAQPEVDAIKDRIAKALTKTVSDSKEHEAVREKAAIALGTIADSRHTPALVAVLKDKSAPLTVRRAAAHGFVMKADRGLVPDFLQIFRDKSDDPYVRVEVAHVLQGSERRHSDASIGAALKAVRMDRSEPPAVRAVARSTQELMDRLKAHRSGGVVKANTSANQVPYGKQVWPNGIIKNITKMAERTIVEAEAPPFAKTSEGWQGTPPEIKTWYDKQFADWKVYNEWSAATITVSGDGEWKVWIRQNVCCLVTIGQDSRGRIDILHAFDREEDLQDLLAGIPLEQEQRARCKRNLQAIESAKGKARRNLRLKAEATLDAAQLSPFIPGGFEALICPNAGQYTTGTAGKQGRCSVHGTQAALGRR